VVQELRRPHDDHARMAESPQEPGDLEPLCRFWLHH
jgi:hypothetical protein